jgi:hypothetical protein
LPAATERWYLFVFEGRSPLGARRLQEGQHGGHDPLFWREDAINPAPQLRMENNQVGLKQLT